jgi:regulatory protein YycI of two-component signal transduction system YycFG
MEFFMNRLVSSLRRIITIFLVVLAFFVSTAFDQHDQAQAEPVTPEATSYQVDSDNNQARIKAERIKDNAEKSAKLLEEEGIKVTNRAAESAQDPNKNLIDSVREKLNLDEPIDPGTKKAARQLKDTVTGNSD